MALRVLLADESSTIKKVLQLALQDFGVEVKSVPIGLDVMQVTRSFNPDIILADVLLAKKNGYEVSAELKSDPILKRIPIVLMWSGFMEIDESKARSCRADRRLEKPFDADTLRQLVKDLVPSLGSNAISNYLSFPEMPEMVEDPGPSTSSPAKNSRIMPQAAPQLTSSTESPDFADPLSMPEEDEIQLIDFDKTRVGSAHETRNTPSLADSMDFPEVEDIEEPEEFQSIPLPKNQGLASSPKAKTPQDDWARQDLSRYKIELPKDDPMSIDEADLTNSSIALSSGAEDISLDRLDELEDLTNSLSPPPRANPDRSANRSAHRSPPISKTFSPSADSHPSHSPVSSLDPMRAEEVLRQEARAVLENIAWKLLPEIVERVVRDELQKLLKDAERL